MEKTKNPSVTEAYLSDNRILTLIKILLASCLIGISAQIKIPLYFTPVPLTIQTSAVMLVGVFLGSRNGALAVLCYLAQGCCGLPVWAGGSAGIAHIFGPTGGYLLAYIVQAYLVGFLFEKTLHRSFIKTTGIFLVSTCVQLGIGTLWLAPFVGIDHCLLCGFLPFIPADFARCLLLSICLISLKKEFNHEN